ncbi:hypothetical protein HDU82_003004 [Entophlyctis luteolus]|nr:hypothetical protein HDU82_003004 [Entophlyctis luteolus]
MSKQELLLLALGYAVQPENEIQCAQHIKLALPNLECLSSDTILPLLKVNQLRSFVIAAGESAAKLRSKEELIAKATEISSSIPNLLNVLYDVVRASVEVSAGSTDSPKPKSKESVSKARTDRLSAKSRRNMDSAVSETEPSENFWYCAINSGVPSSKFSLAMKKSGFFETQLPCLGTMSELQHKIDKWDTWESLTNFEAIEHNFSKTDKIVAFYDKTMFSADRHYIHSDIGKYLGVYLTHIHLPIRILSISVHGIHKHGRARQRYALHKFVEEESARSEVDGIAVGGDFNENPHRLAELFPNLFLGISTDSNISTTTRGTQIDNLMLNDGCFRHSQIIVSKDHDGILDHHPLKFGIVVEI